jgi:hypothetical protein
MGNFKFDLYILGPYPFVETTIFFNKTEMDESFDDLMEPFTIKLRKAIFY